MGSLSSHTPPPNRRNRPDRGKPVRVMIVDDSLIVRTVLSRVIDPEPDLVIVAKTSSAELAIAQLSRTPADVVLLDLEMPGMGGLEALPKILAANRNTQVLVVSSLTEEGAEHTVAALAMGAADTMLKPRTGRFDDAYRDALIAKVRALGSGSVGAVATKRPPAYSSAARFNGATTPTVIGIGASTGGIHAMGILLRHLPGSVTAPILVTQHLPSSFAGVFAKQLQSASGRKAVVAVDDMVLEDSTIYVASGDGHMVVDRAGDRLAITTVRGAMPSGCTPSVDPLYQSLARHVGSGALGIVLSGMGRDGAGGAVDLVAAGGTILVQDQDSAAVWGMPRAIAEAGLASAVLPPAELALRVSHLCRIAA